MFSIEVPKSAQGFPMNDWIPQSNGSLVAVSIQYRLGLLGFLASAEISNNGDLNAGLLDQRAALNWINRWKPLMTQV